MFALKGADLNEAKHRKGLNRKEYSLLLILVLVSLFAFSLLWSNKSFFQEDNTQSESQIANGTYYSHQTTVFTVENYFPLNTYDFRPKVACYFYSNQTNGLVANSPKELQAENVSINYVKVKYIYGEDVLQAPIRVTALHIFMRLKLFQWLKL